MATRKGSGEISQMVIEKLRKNILAGMPWRQPQTKAEELGYGDLIFIDTGHHYALACDFIRDENDTETLITLWSELREDILREHIRHKPGTRPWSWWREDREQRRVAKIDKKMLACNEGRIYESEFEYLARLGALAEGE